MAEETKEIDWKKSRVNMALTNMKNTLVNIMHCDCSCENCKHGLDDFESDIAALTEELS